MFEQCEDSSKHLNNKENNNLIIQESSEQCKVKQYKQWKTVHF